VRRRKHDPHGPIRIENSLGVRVSVSGLLGAVILAVLALLLVRRWTDLEFTVVAGGVAVVVLFAIFLSPEAMVVDDGEVRDESGWRRRGWRIRRDQVATISWEGNPELFEPLQLIFRDQEGEVLLGTTVEFDPDEVSRALRARGWPLSGPQVPTSDS
jgi:hypothetical protein